MEEKGEVSESTLKKIPWFAVVGVLVIFNMLIVQQSPNFMSVVVPAYLSQAFLYIAVGYAFMRGHTEQGFAVFLMAGVWLLENVLVWSNAEVSAWLWIFCLVQLALIYMFFTGKKIRFAGSGGITWTYAALWLIFIFGLSKFIIGLSSGMTLAQMPLWGLGVLLVSFGYIVEPVEKEWSLPFQLIGTLLALISAFTLTAPGLQLLP
jgi:hypothetical protein